MTSTRQLAGSAQSRVQTDNSTVSKTQSFSEATALAELSGTRDEQQTLSQVKLCHNATSSESTIFAND